MQRSGTDDRSGTLSNSTYLISRRELTRHVTKIVRLLRVSRANQPSEIATGEGGDLLNLA